MAIVTKYRNGCPSWVDVAVPDVPAAASFYSSLFGWEAEDQGEQAGHYTMFSIGGRAVAGMGPKQGEMGPPLWATYVSVDDLDSTIASIPGAGGTIVMPRMDIFTAGAMALAVDSSGAAVSFWQAGDHIGSERVNEVNTLVWNELATRDPVRSISFYSAVLGWEFEPLDPSDAGGYQMIKCNDRVVGGMLPMVGDVWGDMTSHWMAYFGTDDTDTTAARAEELGGSISVQPFDISAGRIAVLNDPAGNAFSVITMSGPTDEIATGIA